MIPKHKAKDEIWKYLENNCDQEIDITKLTLDEMYKTFGQQGLSKSDIKSTLNDLIKKNDVVKKEIHIRIYIPKGKSKKIPGEFKRYIVPPMIPTTVLGFYILLGFFLIPSIKNWIISLNLFNQLELVMLFSLVVFVVSHYVGDFFLKMLDYFIGKIDLMKDYMEAVYPMLYTLAIFSIIYIPSAIYMSQFSLGHIIGIISLSVTFGAFIYGVKRWKKKERSV